MENLREQEPSKLLVPTEIVIDKTVKLPEGMTDLDIQDAVTKAQRYLGQGFPIKVQVGKWLLDIMRGEYAGGVCVKSNPIRIEISLSAAELKSQQVRLGYTAGSVMQQLWATVFEETFHAARVVSGEFDFDSYYLPPMNFFDVELQRYVEQPEEKLVEVALNNGILREKFGDTAMRFGKTVFHKL